jgi:ABC-type antimicrobial peptide transport system permease subunit
MAFMVRVQEDPRSVLAGIERQATELDPSVPVADMLTEQGVIDRSLFVERTFTLLSSSFAGIALVLACVGLYGTLSYMVARRTNEIGVRMALGAQRANILEMVMRDGWKMALLGIAMGVPLTLAAAKLVESRVYGISPRDPLSLALGAALVLSIALIVGLLPAWRASRVDPMVALKYE